MREVVGSDCSHKAEIRIKRVLRKDGWNILIVFQTILKL